MGIPGIGVMLRGMESLVPQVVFNVYGRITDTSGDMRHMQGNRVRELEIIDKLKHESDRDEDI